MSSQKKIKSYTAITIGSLGLITNTIALTMYHSSLSPLIVGGMIGSILPLIGCTIIGIMSLNKESLKENVTKPECIKLIGSLSECAVAAMAGSVVCFGIGAGLVALGVTSPIAITILILIANTVVVELLTERFSSPPTPPGSSVDGAKVDDNTPPKSYCC